MQKKQNSGTAALTRNGKRLSLTAEVIRTLAKKDLSITVIGGCRAGSVISASGPPGLGDGDNLSPNCT